MSARGCMFRSLPIPADWKSRLCTISSGLRNRAASPRNSLWTEDPVGGQLGEPIHCNYSLFEVFALRVLGAVVTQTVERLDEHHDGWNAETRNLGCIVQRAGWKLLADTDGFEDGFVAERDELRMKWDGLDRPDLRPLDGTALFGGEALTGGASVAQHAGENVGGEIAHVERCLTAADDRGDDAGECFDAAHGCDGVGMLARDGANFQRELRAGGERVV